MKMPEYMSEAKVKRLCKKLGFRDWSAFKEFAVNKKEAATILQIVNVKKMAIPP